MDCPSNYSHLYIQLFQGALIQLKELVCAWLFQRDPKWLMSQGVAPVIPMSFVLTSIAIIRAACKDFATTHGFSLHFGQLQVLAMNLMRALFSIKISKVQTLYCPLKVFFFHEGKFVCFVQQNPKITNFEMCIFLGVWSSCELTNFGGEFGTFGIIGKIMRMTRQIWVCCLFDNCINGG